MLQAIRLTKKYNNYTALNQLNLSIQPGEIYCLLGKKGAGKTTILNLFLGFVGATSGEAKIDGEAVKPNDMSTKKNIAYIPQVMMLCKNLNCLENADFFSKMAGFCYTEEQLKNFLFNVGLSPDLIYTRIGQSSIAVNQKVALAIAVAKKATVLLMDDPTAWLSNEEAVEFFGLLAKFGGKGKTVLMATHDMYNAINIGARIGVMHQGALVEELSAEDVCSNDLQQLYYKTM